MTLWRIPADVSFADAVAAQLLVRTAGNPLALTDILLLLPTRRACRTMQEAFLRQSGGKSLLLPRMVPLGDLDADELTLSAGVTLPPALPSRRRQLLLSQLIRKFRPEWPLAQCLSMARELARFMDDVASEGADPDKLDSLADVREVAAHWQVTLSFLKPVLTAWPAILEAEGCLDGAVRRNLMLAAQAECWRENPPAYPVIAAGSTGSIPATAEFLKAVLALPTGEVILPALPSAAEATLWWDVVDMTHPHFGLKELLGTLEARLEDVKVWGEDENERLLSSGECGTVRTALLHHALLPAAATGLWAEAGTGTEGTGAAKTRAGQASGLIRVDCAHEQEEATVIALKMREVLETQGKTALLVTPDRMLGRRVGEILRRWSLAIDDSAGAPLSKAAAAVFLRALLDFAGGTGGDDPVRFLSLMKHPLAAGGVKVADCRRFVRWLDRTVLRGARPEGGFSGLRQRISVYEKEMAEKTGTVHVAPDGLEAWLGRVEACVTPLVRLLRSGHDVTLVQVLDELIRAGEALAGEDAGGADGTASASGVARLWKGTGGEALANWVVDLRQAGGDFPPIPAGETGAVLVTLMQDVVVRPRQKDHPRLAILGPMEARLQSADVVILSGLNEGTWPAPPAADPWMSRPMRVDFGLRPAEQRIGQEAHDFYALASAPEVLLTRSVRQGGTPTVPARWLQRLDVAAPHVRQSDDFPLLVLARMLDTPERVAAVGAPCPCPPVKVRPRVLSVTEVETLQKDPYAVYAKKILRLRKLDALNLAPEIRERGTFVHAVLHRMLTEFPEDMAEREAALARMLAIGDDELTRAGLRSVKAWWWPRFTELAGWFVDVQRARYCEYKPRWLEVSGAMDLAVGGGFRVTARADRIDERVDGSLAVIDYKTGSLSTKKERESGASIQLPLEAAIAQAGGFRGVPAERTVRALQFWRVTGARNGGEIEDFSKAGNEVPAQSAERALRVLEALVRWYDDEAHGYPCEPAGKVKYSDYRHLARVNEWSVAGADDDEDGEHE